MIDNNRGWTKGPDSHELYVEAMEAKAQNELSPATLLGGVVIPADSVAAVRLIIEEAAAVLKGHAERMHEMAAPDDWKSKTAAMLTMDHVKKLAWVHGLLTPPNPEGVITRGQ